MSQFRYAEKSCCNKGESITPALSDIKTTTTNLNKTQTEKPTTQKNPKQTTTHSTTQPRKPTNQTPTIKKPKPHHHRKLSAEAGCSTHDRSAINNSSTKSISLHICCYRCATACDITVENTMNKFFQSGPCQGDSPSASKILTVWAIPTEPFFQAPQILRPFACL